MLVFGNAVPHCILCNDAGRVWALVCIRYDCRRDDFVAYYDGCAAGYLACVCAKMNNVTCRLARVVRGNDERRGV